MFEHFREHRIAVSGTEIFLRQGGDGPPLLLLHGYPQTHVVWHKVAPVLARHFTVICPDLRGYGASDKPVTDPDHTPYSKRAMARDMVKVMEALGFPRFLLAGHDRGGRIAHRLCLDHPDRVRRVAVLDIVPTRTLFESADREIATGYYHWFFLIQPDPLPERLIGGDPRFYLRWTLERWSGGATDGFAPEALEAYEQAFRDPATIHATCEDYRAAAGIDLAHDAADEDRRIGCPLLVLWGAKGFMDRRFDMLEVWREKASGPVTGRALPCGHFLPEEAPEETTRELAAFFQAAES